MTSPAYTIGHQVLRRGGRMVLDRQARLVIEGQEHIPNNGPALLVARHYHNLLDGCALYQATARPVHILVGLDWAGTGFQQRVMERLCRTVRWPIIQRPDELEDAPVSRKQELRRRLREGTREAVDLLANGHLVVVFPEGHPVVDPHAKQPRKHQDGLLPFQPGVVRLGRMAERATDGQIPLIPVGFAYERGEDDGWSITMRVGRSIVRSDDEARTLSLLQDAVAELSGVSD